MGIKVEAKLGLKKEKFKKAKDMLEKEICEDTTGCDSIFSDLELLGFESVKKDDDGNITGASFTSSDDSLDIKKMVSLGAIASLLEPGSCIDFKMNGEKVRILFDPTHDLGWKFQSSQIDGDCLSA